jgi:uncharacterized protein YukE|tara:strand:- start:2230 stop:5763 length:3534 start_codon:yes stop_codon:yes gene_type:complete
MANLNFLLPPSTSAPAAPQDAASVQADRVRQYLDAGVDAEGTPIIYDIYPPSIGEGSIGAVGSPLERVSRREVFPEDVERKLEPKYIELIEKYYGAPEVDIPREGATGLDRLMTAIVGRRPGESELAAERTASERGGTADFLDRYMREKLGGFTPSPGEVRGDAPPDASPAERVLLSRYGYRPQTTDVRQRVELRDYGRTPIRDPEQFRELTGKANDALRWLAELPQAVTPDGKPVSVAEDIVGELLVTDMNLKFGTPNRQFTKEDLDLKIQRTGAGDKRLTFMHPTEGRQPINPVDFEWADALDALPGAYVVAGDVLGSIAGGVAGSVKPGMGTFLGATAGGVVGAVASKWLVMDKALRDGEFVYDDSKGGWVSNKGGSEKIIPLGNFIDDLVDEGLWSAGGSVLGSTIFRIGKAILTRGGAEAQYFVSKEQWDDAYRAWGESKFGRKLSESGIEGTPSMILERQARALREQAGELVGKEADDLIKRASALDISATKLRKAEQKVAPEGAIERDRAGRALEEGTRTIDGSVIPRAIEGDAEKFGQAVETAVRSGDGARINKALDDMAASNQRLIDDWEASFKGTSEGAEAQFGQSVRQSAEAALGLGQGATVQTTKKGIYGALNAVRNRARQFKQKSWDIGRVAKKIEGEIKMLGPSFKGNLAAYPPEIQGLIQRLSAGSAGKENIPVNFSQFRQLADKVSDEIGKTTGETQRRLLRLQDMLRNAEGQGFKNIDPDLFKQWKTAQDNLKAFRAVWTNELDRGLTELNADQLANKFLRSMNDGDTVNAVLGDLKKLGVYGKQQEDLLRNVLKTRLRSALTRTLKEGDEIDIAGRPRSVKIGDQRFGTDTVSSAQFSQFMSEYGPWVRQLFPDDPNLEKFAQKVARGQTLQGRYKKISRMEQDLKNLPFLQNQNATDLQRLALEDPSKLFDLAWQTGRRSVENTKSIRELQRILKRGLEPEEFAIADQRLKALALKRLWNPGDEFAGKAAGPETIDDITSRSLRELDVEGASYKLIFGDQHVKNMRQLFKEMDALANPRQAGVVGLAEKELEKGMLKKIPGLIARVWVGVLNTKARALNLGTKFIKYQDEAAFKRLLTDPKALDRALKIRTSKVGRISANAIGSALFGKDDMSPFRQSEIEELIDTYTITDPSGNRRPVPIQTQRQAVDEALGRVLGP